MTFQATDFVVDPSGESSSHCESCGRVTRDIWGYIATQHAWVAFYDVQSTVGHLENDPAFNLVLGSWGGESKPDDRFCVSLR